MTLSNSPINYYAQVIILVFTLLGIALTCNSAKLNAQSENVDSLKALLPGFTTAPERGDLLLKLALVLSTSDPTAAINYATKGVELALENKLDGLAGKSYRQRGLVHQRAGKYDLALSDFRQAYDLVMTGTDSNLISTVMIDLGTVEQSLGNVGGAEKWLRKALKIDRARRDTSGIAAALTNLASNANQLGDVNRAISYLDTVLVLDSLQQSWSYFSQGLGNIALIYQRQNNKSKAISYALRGLRAADEAADDGGRYLNSAILSEIYLRLQDLDPALIYGRRAVTHARSFGKNRVLGQSYSLLREVFQERMAFDSANFYFVAGEQITDPAHLPGYYNNWGTYHKDQRRDTTAAKLWYQKAITAAELIENNAKRYLPLVNLATIAAAREDWPAAHQLLLRAKAYDDQSIDLSAATMATIGRVYVRSGDPVTANDYLLRATNLHEKIVREHDSTRVLLANYERDIAEMNYANQEERLAVATREVTVRNRYLMVGGLLMLTLGGVFWKSVQQRRKLARANHQLEVLRKEVHHRVRNDFQSIASMFFVHLHGMEDETQRKTLNSVYDRVKGMGQIHALLQESQGRDQSLEDHLHALVSKRLAALPAEPSPSLSFSYDLPEAVAKRFSELQIRQLGILLNELITNAGKYAFVGNPAPMMTVRAGLGAGRQAVFTVSDNGGVGEAPGNTSGTSFGMEMINTICKSLNWTFTSTQTSVGRNHLIHTNINV